MKIKNLIYFHLFLNPSLAVGQEINKSELHWSFDMISEDKGKSMRYFENVFLGKGYEKQLIYRYYTSFGFIDGKHVLRKETPIELSDPPIGFVSMFRMGSNRITLITNELISKNDYCWYLVVVELLAEKWEVKTKYKIESMAGIPRSDLKESTCDLTNQEMFLIHNVTTDGKKINLGIRNSDLTVQQLEGSLK